MKIDFSSLSNFKTSNLKSKNTCKNCWHKIPRNDCEQSKEVTKTKR